MQDSHLAHKKVYFNQLQANNWIINKLLSEKWNEDLKETNANVTGTK